MRRLVLSVISTGALLCGCYTPPGAIQLDPKEMINSPVPAQSPTASALPSPANSHTPARSPSGTPSPSPSPTNKTKLAGIKSIEVSPTIRSGEISTVTVVGEESSTCQKFDSIRDEERVGEVQVTLLNQDHSGPGLVCGQWIRNYTVQAVFTLYAIGVYRIVGNGKDYGSVEVK